MYGSDNNGFWLEGELVLEGRRDRLYIWMAGGLFLVLAFFRLGVGGYVAYHEIVGGMSWKEQADRWVFYVMNLGIGTLLFAGALLFLWSLRAWVGWALVVVVFFSVVTMDLFSYVSLVDGSSVEAVRNLGAFLFVSSRPLAVAQLLALCFAVPGIRSVMRLRIQAVEPDNPTPSFSYAKAMVKLMGLQGATDGELSKAEEAWLRNFLSRFSLPPFTQRALFEWAIKSEPEPVTELARQALEPARQLFGQEAAQRILTELKEFARADGHLEPDEVAFLKEVGQALGLSEEETQWLVASA